MSIYRHRFTDRDLAIPEVKIDGEDNTVKAIYLKKNSLIQKGIK